MNKEKQELLKNPLVKELMMHFAAEYNLGEWNIVSAFNRYVKSQQSPKEWEVMAYAATNSNIIYKKFPDGTFDSWSNTNSCGLSEAEINTLSYPIHSIKRLSDGEVFTVGDEVYFLNNERSGKSWIINNFYELENGTMLARSKNNIIVEAIADTLRKSKHPLFTTEDGKEIFEGGEYFFVNHAFYIVASVATSDNGWGGALNYPEYKRFSTKEAAEEYVANNKPMLSVNDIKKLYAPINPNTGHIVYWDELVRLAKSKIK